MATGEEHQGRGVLSQIKGAIKEGFGALTGDRSTEAKGKGERAKGVVQEEYGRIKTDLTSDDPTRKL